MRHVSSRQHPVVRRFRALARTPDPGGVWLLADGLHLVRDAHAAGLHIEACAVAAGRLAADSAESGLAARLDRQGVDVFAVPDGIFSALSPVRSPSGIAAIVRREPTGADDVLGAPRLFALAAVDVQDPGNLGSLVRTAEAGGASGVLACGSSANPFSWKALRGSMGSALRLPLAAGVDTDALLIRLRADGVRTLAAVPRGGRDPDLVDWSGRVALLLGGEGEGLPADLVSRCDEQVSVPMAPAVESLNVSAAGAVLVYAARRQRV